MGGKYIPDGAAGFREATLAEWAEWHESRSHGRAVESFRQGGWRVGVDEFASGARVSTVLLGLDHNFGPAGPPILFETMIFGGKHNDYQERYATLAEAEEGHERAVAMVSGEVRA